jgi:uncharacterized protein YecE (DUF72 family)
MSSLIIGTAAWNIPKLAASEFPSEGSHLERYAQRLHGVEINSSFYREHQPATYRRWAESTPESFRFSVKLARRFLQEGRLAPGGAELARVVLGIQQLGPKLAVLLVQLPPRLEFEARVAENFFMELRALYAGPVAFEPRHRSWLTAPARALQRRHRLSKVIADPDPCPLNDAESAQDGLAYFRLHGSPTIYQSDYDAASLAAWHTRIEALRRTGLNAWCIFDNTTFGYATQNALALQSRSEMGLCSETAPSAAP